MRPTRALPTPASSTTLGVVARNGPLYGAIAELPADSVIAGWPGKEIDNVPYVSRRAALLTFETHQVFHKQYADVMRKPLARADRRDHRDVQRAADPAVGRSWRNAYVGLLASSERRASRIFQAVRQMGRRSAAKGRGQTACAAFSDN
jgi:hypothetical protein